MRRYSIILDVLVISSFATGGFAQTSAADPVKQAINSINGNFTPTITQSDLPAGPNAWVLRIVSSGGFAGQTSGLTIASLGNVRCSELNPCRANLSNQELQNLNGLLSEPALMKWEQSATSLVASANPAAGSCSDCTQISLELRIRDSNGEEKSYFATWNEVSKSRLPVEVKQIYEAAVVLRR